jgi:hypothetical protein
MKRLYIFGLVSIAVGLLLGSSLQAAAVKEINLAAMATAAQTIFSGVCIERQTLYDVQHQREVVAFTFRVEQMLKGAPQDRLTVKASKTLVDLRQVPTYHIGQEVVLFLSGASRLGFSSPVGLGQGRFQVLQGPGGQRVVVNDRNNRNLFKAMDMPASLRGTLQSGQAAPATPGPLRYEEFVDLVRALAGQGARP